MDSGPNKPLVRSCIVVQQYSLRHHQHLPRCTADFGLPRRGFDRRSSPRQDRKHEIEFHVKGRSESAAFETDAFRLASANHAPWVRCF
jgi:hypothetical protein